MFHVCSFYIKGLLESLISNYGEKGERGAHGGTGQKPRPGKLDLTSLVGSATVGPQAGWGWGDPAEWGKDERVRSLDPEDAKPPSRGLERRSPPARSLAQSARRGSAPELLRRQFFKPAIKRGVAVSSASVDPVSRTWPWCSGPRPRD